MTWTWSPSTEHRLYRLQSSPSLSTAEVSEHWIIFQTHYFRSATMIRALLVLAVLGSVRIGWVDSHKESGEWRCDSGSEIQVEADFRPGIVTLDGHADEWKDIDGFEFSLLPALDPHEEHEYKSGKMTVKALHDGNDVFFMLQVDGDYAYSKGNNKKCPSVALMFQIGENASYHNMGGCTEATDTCNNKTCHGHEVDIMHFSIGNAIPGRLYGGNPVDNRDGNGGDRFGHLVDLYSWNPHCRYLDGLGPSGSSCTIKETNLGLLKSSESDETVWNLEVVVPLNDHFNRSNFYASITDYQRFISLGVAYEPTLYLETILVHRITGKVHGGTVASLFTQLEGAPTDDSDTYSCFVEDDSPYASNGQKGTYYFEFSRPLRTMDRLQQDAQFTIGESSKMSVAFWYPVDGNPWHGSGHYSVNCDWVPLDILLGGSLLNKVSPRSSWDAASAFALLLSVVAFCLSIFVGYRVTQTRKNVAFSPMDNL